MDNWSSIGASARHWASSMVTVNITGLTAAEQTLAMSALQLWHDVANISFTYTTGAANITYNHNGSYQAFTSSSTSGPFLTSATIDISSNWWPNTNINSYMFQAYIHETGHALGLGHQGPYNGSGTYGVSNIFTTDTWRSSIMSYFSQNNYGGSSYDYTVSPEMADIWAMQTIYGAAPSTRSGSTTYGFHSNAGTPYDFAAYSGTPAFTIYDTGGTDTLDASGYSNAQTIDLRPGMWSSVGGYTNNIGIYLTTTVENAVGGSGNDTFYGNTANNTFTGNAGVDTVCFAGNLFDFQFTESNNHSYTATGASQGTDTLSSIDHFVFNDFSVTDDLIGGASTAASVGAGSQTSGNIQFRGDHDWFATTLIAGRRLYDRRAGRLGRRGYAGRMHSWVCATPPARCSLQMTTAALASTRTCPSM